MCMCMCMCVCVFGGGIDRVRAELLMNRNECVTCASAPLLVVCV